MIKAWMVRERDEFYATVVFAETREKARVVAQWTATCCGAKYIDIEVYRCKNADKYYREGKVELDWNDPADRIALVKDCGFTCLYVEPYMCELCSAKEYCDKYQEELFHDEKVRIDERNH